MKKRVLLAAVLAVTVLFGACKPYVPDELSWLMESGEIVDSIADQSEEPESVMGDLMNQIESANEAASESLSSTSDSASDTASSSARRQDRGGRRTVRPTARRLLGRCTRGTLHPPSLPVAWTQDFPGWSTSGHRTPE